MVWWLLPDYDTAYAQGGPTPTPTPKYWMGDPVVVEKDFVNPNTVTDDYYTIGPSDLNSARVGFYIPGVGYTIPNGAAFGDCGEDLDLSVYQYCSWANTYSDACSFFGLGAGTNSCTTADKVDDQYKVQSTGNYVRVMYDAVVYPIYASALEAAPVISSCLTDTMSATLGSGIISATVEAGYYFTDFVTIIDGYNYILTTTDGPWSDGTYTNRYDVAISLDAGSTWVALGEFVANNDPCYYQDGVHSSVVISLTADAMIRVNDIAGAFGDNSGAMGIDISVIYEIDNDTGQFDFHDGDMELVDPTYWKIKPPFANNWGRIFSWDIWKTVFYPDPVCNDGMQVIGDAKETVALKYYSPVNQYFYWPGGDMYYRFSVRRLANLIDELLYDAPDYLVKIERLGSPTTAEELQGQTTSDWVTVTGMFENMIPGNYRIILDYVSNDYFETDTVGYDDVWVGEYEIPACQSEYIPATPTPTLSPTPGTPRQYIDNCGFEDELVDGFWVEYGGLPSQYFYNVPYWDFSYPFIEGFSEPTNKNAELFYGDDGDDPSPGGGNYLILHDDGNVVYEFPSPYLLFPIEKYTNYYFKAWVKGFIVLRIQGLSESMYGYLDDYPVIVDSVLIDDLGPTNEWQFVTKQFNSDDHEGLGVISFQKGSETSLDDIFIGNYDGYCTDTDLIPTITPTGGPTSTPTLISTLKPTHTNTPNPTFTPLPTNTPGPSQLTATSMQGTQIAAEGTATAWAVTATADWLTATSLYATMTAAAATATAQGTPVMTITATSTPTPLPSSPTPLPTGTATGTPAVMQPAGACDAQCIRPQGFDPAEWTNYQICKAEKYIAWCPYHSATMVSLQSELGDKEPFGTINDMQSVATEVVNIIGGYDWDEGSVGGSAPDINAILTPAANSPYLGGVIDLNDTSDPFDTDCEMKLEPYVGEVLTKSMCWAFDVAETVGYTPWANLMLNFFVFASLGAYLNKVWLSPAMHT